MNDDSLLFEKLKTSRRDYLLRGTGGCFGGNLLASPSKKKLIRSLTVVQQRSRKKYPVKPSDYQLYEEVGVGSSGIVYRALCVSFSEIVAIKVVDLDKPSATLDTICHGVQVMALNSHPNVLRAHCSFVVDCNLWVVMPYIAGGSCLHLMKAIYQEGFKESVIASFLREVLKALFYLHNQGQIHGNVKAGNILVDASGAVILGDFGFSTCTFDNGDTQCSTKAFVGTSNWMAPEVKEQPRSCGPGIDIWSFGITALELSQGHDSFNKDSPMKTSLQRLNGGNNNERHKKLSKPFLEMIAKCLKKDASQRPSAIKLLKHSFFKNALNSEVEAETVFDGLPPLGDQFKALKLKEAGTLEEKKVSSEEQGDQSQSEYKKGVSSWNFNLEDLEFQTSSIQDAEELHYTKAIENPNPMKEIESMVKTELVGPENNGQGGDYMIHLQSHSLEDSVPLQSRNGLKENVDVFEGDINPHSMPEMEHIKFKDHKLVVLQAQKDDGSKVHDCGDTLEKKDSILEDGHHVSEQIPNVGNVPPGGDKSNRDQHQTKLEQNSSRSTNFQRVNVTHSSDCIYRRTNTAGNRDSLGEMSAVPAVQKKGRFKVTSENLDPEPPTVVPSSTNSKSTVAMATILPFMQNISERNDTQREQIVNLIKSLSQGKFSSAHFSNLGTKLPSCNGFDNLTIEAPSEREQELLQQVVELQIRVTNIAHEIQEGKRMNIKLERQLSALKQRKEVDHKREAL
ncbi:uncharacterized protein LOC131040287 isoform X2 [Cryptomeria japonica]|uniref:uncharacterized protein LOC131040287 isoform X2 n=1 Tax=Cryptomeria japonica TaxID=3369 RepID=UPI0025ABCB2A|nr:uncharacterized protein LOC131040287 isoform X2 [Cryptomeria japonica]